MDCPFGSYYFESKGSFSVKRQLHKYVVLTLMSFWWNQRNKHAIGLPIDKSSSSTNKKHETREDFHELFSRFVFRKKDLRLKNKRITKIEIDNHVINNVSSEILHRYRISFF